MNSNFTFSTVTEEFYNNEDKIMKKENLKWSVKYRGKKVKLGGETRTIIFRLIMKESNIDFLCSYFQGRI